MRRTGGNGVLLPNIVHCSPRTEALLPGLLLTFGSDSHSALVNGAICLY